MYSIRGGFEAGVCVQVARGIFKRVKWLFKGYISAPGKPFKGIPLLPSKIFLIDGLRPNRRRRKSGRGYAERERFFVRLQGFVERAWAAGEPVRK
jgi:hypothetical protein